ncbi:MAG: Kelch repeat-containing protein [Alphaproteobacteria bacterium]
MLRLITILWVLITPALAAEWQILADMHTSRSEITAAHLNGHIYVAGGISIPGTRKEFEAYDIASGTWAKLAPLPKPLHHVALAAASGKIYATGGYVALDFSPNDPELWEYDPGEDRWVRKADMPAARGEHAMVSWRGKLYVISGRGQNARQVWEYDPASDTWTADRAPIPTYRHSAAVMLNEVTGQVYVAGGRDDTYSVLTPVEVYDIPTDTWKSLPDLPTPLGGHGGAYYGGNLHIFGGELLDSAEVLDEHYVLNLASGIWTEGPPLAKPRHGIAYITVNGITYVIGGGSKAGWRTYFFATDTLQAYTHQ